MALPEWPTTAWLVVLVLVYLCGHLAQSIGNIMLGRLVDCETLLLDSEGAKRLPTPVIDAAKRKVGELMGIEANEIDAKSFYRACDHAIARHGDYGDRDVYIYREGFYRGLTVSFLAAALAILFRAIVALILDAPVRVAGMAEIVGFHVLGLLIAMMLGASWLSLSRFRRFGEYRVSHAVFGLAVLETPATKTSASQQRTEVTDA